MDFEKQVAVVDYCEYVADTYEDDCEKHCIFTNNGECALNSCDAESVDEMYKRITPVKPKVDMVNHPPHYTRDGAMETIDEMELIFGTEAVKHYCLLNAWKYRARALHKNKEQDLSKSDWYLKKYKECKEKLECQPNNSVSLMISK